MRLFFLLLLSPLVAWGEGSEPNQVLVQGRCDLKVVPDRGSVTFTAENQLKDQKEAVRRTNGQVNDLKEKIQSLKLTDLELKTTSYQVSPVREWEKDRLVDKGMKASLTLEVTTSDIARLGEAMMMGSQVGIQQVSTLSTYLSPEKNQSEYLKCLDMAAEDARRKALQLGSKLGFKVGAVIKVVEAPLHSEPTPPQMLRGMMKGESADASSTVEAGLQSFSTSIQVAFDIK